MPFPRELRRSKGLTAAELALRVGITENAIRKLESGSSGEPRFGTGLRLARALGVSPEAIAPVADKRVAGTGDSPLQLGAIVRVIRQQRSALVHEGVKHAAIFGSFARGDATEQSDVDVVVDTDPRFSLFELVGVREILEAAIHRSVDVVTRRTLESSAFAAARDEAVDVF